MRIKRSSREGGTREDVVLSRTQRVRQPTNQKELAAGEADNNDDDSGDDSGQDELIEPDIIAGVIILVSTYSQSTCSSIAFTYQRNPFLFPRSFDLFPNPLITPH